MGAIFGLEVFRRRQIYYGYWNCALVRHYCRGHIYDLNDFNDRLILRFKGTMSEAELHFLRSRLLGGKKNKAHKGELRFPLPVGYCHDEYGNIIIDPDEGVQTAIRSVFSAFKATGSAYGVVMPKTTSLSQKGLRWGVGRQTNLGRFDPREGFEYPF